MSNILKTLAAGSASEPTDPYFNQTTLLLHGDGTNGAQNNTFLDSSTNNFTITRNGNTTQGTFSPFSVADGEWSNYFDASGNVLSIQDNAAFTLGSGNFTIEVWVYKTISGRQFVSWQGNDSGQSASASFKIEINSTEKLVAGIYSGGTTYFATSTGSISLNTWTHIALVRNGNTVTNYINGVADGTVDVTGVSATDSSEPVKIGDYTTLGGLAFKGYISNFRFVKGTAVYTSAFTPSTSPLTAISGTSLLTCQSNRFVDNSSNAFAITVNGTPSVQPFSPFAPSAAYSTSVNGGSGYFDGSGDYLTLATNAALNMGTGDFTVEMWVYSTDASIDTQYRRFFASDVNGTSSIQIGHVVSTNGVAEYCDNGSSGVLISGTTNILNQWAHIAAVRSSGTVTLYVNGVSEGTPASDTGNKGSADFTIGKYPSASGHLKGWLASLRVVKGTAVYTTTFTPPTAPLTAIANTSLLCNLTNAGIFDNTGKNNLETVGNAQIDTTTKKYGTGSMEFDGTGDYLLIPNSPLFSFGSGPFTIELWIYPSATANTAIIDARTTSDAVPWGIFYDAADMKPYFFTGSSYKSSTALSTGAWQHLAVTRDSSSTLKMFLDGVEVHSTGSVTTSLDRSGTIVIGVNKALNNPLTGFIDDLRITRGVARYTTTFTPPSRAFPDL